MSPTEQKSTVLLEVRNLRTYFSMAEGIIKAVDGVDFSVNSGEVMGLVGESGCGKSVTSYSILNLVNPPGKIVEGQILFEGQDLLGLDESSMDKIRGNRISMIFQQPQSSLNPVRKIGGQVAEVLKIHKNIDQKEAWRQAVALLELVGIPDAARKVNAYPHEMSGGQAQRVMIAMALAMKPQLLIADEPTTALDVTIQAQILDLMLGLRKQLGTAIILITHDLGVIAEMADRVAVMYAGQIVECTSAHTLFKQPLHPYTQGLIGSIPVLGNTQKRLDTIPGMVPNMIDLPPGCRFAPRCQLRTDRGFGICVEKDPNLLEVDSDHTVRCWAYSNQVPSTLKRTI